MRHHRHLFSAPVIMVCLLIFLTSCAPPKANTDPALDKAAITRARAVRQLNSDIQTSRGMGSLTLIRPQTREKYKLAWAAQAPNRLRLTLLALGHPVETIAASGEWVSIISHTGRHNPLSAVSTDPDLTPYINVPVRLSELISILLGKVPLRPFDRAWFVQGKPDTIQTQKSFSSFVQQIQFSPEGRVLSLSLLDKKGTLVYTIAYKGYQTQENRSFPRDLTLTGPGGNKLDLSLYNFFPNAPVKEAVFRLTGSGS